MPRSDQSWIPSAGRAIYGNFDDYFPKDKEMLAEAGAVVVIADIDAAAAEA